MMKHPLLALSTWALATTALTPAFAAPIVDPALGDHAVLQRGKPIVISGWAAPGETVSASLAGKMAQGAADASGRFRLTLPAQAAGGPYRLLISAKSGQQTVDDLLIGDVLLCSGQSNMELTAEQSQNSFQIAGADDPRIRLMTVAKKLALQPQDRFETRPAWTPATPAAIAKFSAVCFYTGQALRKTADVPIGLIHASWGGSRISAWLSPEGLKAGGLEAQAKTLAVYARDTAGGQALAARDWETWWKDGSGLASSRLPWRDDSDLAWRPATIGYFSRWPTNEMTGYVGMSWFRTEVTVTAEQARQPAMLSLGAIDDADITFINGRAVGGSSMGAPRRYRLEPGVLVEGRNVIMVNVDNVYADGGLVGPASTMALEFDDGARVSIADGWRYVRAGRPKTNAPRPPWDDINGAGTLYNGMIAPLGSVGLAGVVWYQGESDTGLAGYDRRLKALFQDWRRQFDAPALPFAVVQLSAYGDTASRPVESGWAKLRDIQRRVTEDDGHAAVVVSIDLGDRFDIHPGEKQEVGRRAATALQALFKGEGKPSGPRIASATRAANGGVVLTFKDVSGGLASQGADVAIGFELCGSQGDCRYATARASGDRVILAADGKPAQRVRYAWADTPAVNLFDQAGQPVGPFETDIH